MNLEMTVKFHGDDKSLTVEMWREDKQGAGQIALLGYLRLPRVDAITPTLTAVKTSEGRAALAGLFLASLDAAIEAKVAETEKQS